MVCRKEIVKATHSAMVGHKIIKLHICTVALYANARELRSAAVESHEKYSTVWNFLHLVEPNIIVTIMVFIVAIDFQMWIPPLLLFQIH